MSVETTPQTAGDVSTYRHWLPGGTEVHVAHVGDGAFGDVLALCRRLAAQQLRPVPHLVARNIADSPTLGLRLDALREAGCERILLIAGDRREPAGPFGDTLAVLNSGVLAAHGFAQIDVAGHPSGSSTIDYRRYFSALREKLDWAASAATELRIITQFGFDPAALARWEADVAATGHRPVVLAGIGVATSLDKLQRYATICGVSEEPQVARNADEMLRSVAGHRQTHDRCLIAGCHLFAFAGVGHAADYLRGCSPE